MPTLAHLPSGISVIFPEHPTSLCIFACSAVVAAATIAASLEWERVSVGYIVINGAIQLIYVYQAKAQAPPSGCTKSARQPVVVDSSDDGIHNREFVRLLASIKSTPKHRASRTKPITSHGVTQPRD
ncbi:hypothetical protein QBC42DRAFT_289833 [Cladorrhinum samala]|uniref:Uncharacterized protein n=1 Tax=Cladorrhinum samala TaxID=585594 RepID=A0AAV9HED5_9PEZI|nr:hypothetical protein QBC42DRAFT_289833 [Cladorrhinum samala]